MPKYVIERELPGAGKLSREQLRAVAQKSNGIIQTLGDKIQWVETYVVGRQAVLRLQRGFAEDHRGAREVRRFPRQPDLAGPRHHGPDDRRSLRMHQ